jgi:hypothetical protein
MQIQLLHSTLLALATASASHAGIVWSGPANVPVPFNFDGVYLNPFTGATSATQPADWNAAPWLNPFFGGVDIGNDALMRPVITGADQVVNLGLGETISAASTFAAGESGSTTHVGAAANQFQLGTPGYLGFAFEPTIGGATYYGWAQIKISNTGAGTILGWAYDDAPGTAIRAGATPVPEPGTALFGLALLGTALIRRHRADTASVKVS